MFKKIIGAIVAVLAAGAISFGVASTIEVNVTNVNTNGSVSLNQA